MTWLEGEIKAFAGKNPQHADLRKIQTRPGQDWQAMHFFRVEDAREAGYPDPALTAGKKILFEPDQRTDRPRVARFKPYDGPVPGRQRPSAGRDAAGSFLNPYHFIPLHAPAESDLRPASDVLTKGVLHHRFGSPSPEHGGPLFSGRILCRLETEGPVVVGSGQDQPRPGEDRETVVSPFELPDPRNGSTGTGRPAIPGSSLRGLISSLVEAASSSAMRVLSDSSYTRRALVTKDSQEGLSAIGMLVENGGDLRLRPLSMSLEEMKLRKGDPPPDRYCRVLVGEYRKQGRRLQPVPESFLARHDPLSWSASHREYRYCDLHGAQWHPRSGLPIGVRPNEPPIPASEWEKLGETGRGRYTRGILLVVGLDGSKAENLPDGKKFEFFLPYPEGETGEGRKTLEIAPEALSEFRQVARDAASLRRGGKDEDFPYLHRGRSRDGRGVEPRADDLVYYETDPRTDRVSRIAFTAIWRRPVHGSVWQAVRGCSADLVPFSRPERSGLTLAERLFGFVEQQDRGAERSAGRSPALALAGRVRFSHGLAVGDEPENGWYEPEVTLKILASPKPPSPALYFGNEPSNEGRSLAKSELDLRKHSPQGRKVYLHQRDEEVDGHCYETRHPADNLKQKLRVRPLRPGTEFLFHVDFHNLERAELGHLLYALRPTEAFRHKLGLGKPIGLGRVRIDPVAVAHVHRGLCYQPENLFGPRFQAVEWLDRPIECADLDDHLQARYRWEWQVGSEEAIGDGIFPAVAKLLEETRTSIHPGVRDAIELVGDPNQVDLPVTYPVLAGAEPEGEHFRWFVQNDRIHRQRLEPLEAGKPLPALARHPQPKKKGGRQSR